MEYLKFDLNPSCLTPTGNVARFKFYPNRVLMSNGLFYSNLDPKSFFFIFSDGVVVETNVRRRVCYM